MRIALLTYSTKPRGGVVHTLALAEALAAAGEDVTVVALDRAGGEGFFRSVHAAVRLDLVAFPDVVGEGVGERIVRSIAVLADHLRPRRSDAPAGLFDVVHAQDCISANAALDAGLGEGLGERLGDGAHAVPCPRLVRTVHHLDTFTTPALAACHERAVVEPRTHVCVSAAVARELHDGWGITARVIPNGVDAGRFAAAASADTGAVAARAAWRARLGRYVLAVGGIEPRKGTLDLVEAMSMLRRRPGHERVALVIAGGETLFDYRDYARAVTDRAATLGVEPVVLGPVADGDLPSLVAAADVMAFPSTREGFGLAAMEALAAGVPLVTRDLPVLREVFGGAARFATEPAGFARALAQARSGGSPHDGEAERLREAGVAVAGRHTWAAAAAAHRELYASLAADTARAS